ncbi:TPA: hypothetical protein QHA87_003355 [Aeromonas dhakensis]|nr:hypothetical protein [Aeromonas dhakensis]HEB4980998.1 hypothetical protein [Aeromonas dhakensis]
MKRTSFPLAAVAALLMASAAHAGQPADAARVVFRRRLHQFTGLAAVCA